VPTAHRWVPVSCLPATTHEVNYAFLSSGPAYSSDFASSAVTHTVLPPVSLSFEPLPAIPVSKAQPCYAITFCQPSYPTCPCDYPTPGSVGQTIPAAQTLHREYFERLATVNGWATTEQKTEQLALALKGPASEVLRDLDTSQPKLTVSSGRLWHAASVLLMALEKLCVALTLGARRKMRKFQILNKPSVLYTCRAACRYPRTAGCSPETPFRGRVDFY